MAQKRHRKRTTIKAIAEEARTSTATVSYVLNAKGAVAPDTRERVLAVARDLGYETRVRLPRRTGGGGRLDLVTLVWVNTSPHWQQSWLSNQLSHTLMVSLQESGARLQTLFYNEDGRPGPIVAGEEDALLIAGRPGADFSRKIPAGLPHVNIICQDYPSAAPFLDIDSISAGFSLTQYLIARGHRHIGFVSNDRDHPYFGQRYIGYLRAMDQAHLPICPEWIVRLEGAPSVMVETSEPIDTLDDELRGLIERLGLPCAIVAANDWIASAVYQYTQRNGLRVPEDVSVVGCDNDPGICKLLRPGLTTHTVPYDQVGREAIHCLRALADGRPLFHERLTMLLRGRLIERASVAEVEG